MKLYSLRLSNFQSFSREPTELVLDDITYLIGPNGAGKTTTLQALCRLFAFDPGMRRVLRSDFHVPPTEEEPPEERSLWIEADFHFPELEDEEDSTTVAPHFNHMRIDEQLGVPRVRYRLSATLGPDGDVEEELNYVLEVDGEGEPTSIARVNRTERGTIQLHYLPARRDPAEHITYGANALLGRLLRAVDWTDEREQIRALTDQISDSLGANPGVVSVGNRLKEAWEVLHKGSYFSDPNVTFVTSEIESLLRHLSVAFSPGHEEQLIDFTRLSDGQKSMLYLALVISTQAVSRSSLSGDDLAFDLEKLRPPVFTLIALEEPENSLSPHYLGRIVNALKSSVAHADSQALIATHAPSMLRRAEPESIRYLRLSEERTTNVSRINMPSETDEAHKFVRQGVQAFPEIFFARLVVLGEGDSEEIILPRVLAAKGSPVDESAISVAPLGGRHVNHFWRLLSKLGIPYVTLLDLDVSRYQGGWGRIKYVNDQLAVYQPGSQLPEDHLIPAWNDDSYKIRDYENYLELLESKGVFFSAPLDLDFSMLLAYPDNYGVEIAAPEDTTINAVLGKSHHDSTQYTEDEKDHFNAYHRLFKLSSKPAAHLDALGGIDDAALLESMPATYARLAEAVIAKLSELPE